MSESQPIIIVVRHGARLDAADKDWHLTSPTPYDPPLCYGGWIQSRALGMRIGSILQAPDFIGRNPEQEASDEPLSDKDPMTAAPATSDLYNRYNVIVHTSPFLRCLQTSIAISAGLSQYGLNKEPPTAVDTLQRPHGDVADVVPRPLMRVDAFLGEWLSPDYFDQIIPPPSSDRMIALAKADLLRRGEIIPPAREPTRAFSGHFPGGWGNHSPQTSPSEDDSQSSPLRGSSSTPKQSPQRQRASTVDRPQSSSAVDGASTILSRLDTDLAVTKNASYAPPTPAYAVSASDSIPAGYVAHARDACVKIDYQWDSMRTPCWGTGGEYGEEWSSMQERVADGFDRMMKWYRQPEACAPYPSRAADKSSPNDGRPSQDVLILVTHGADCNALINSLAGHSVLLDIATASLTVAVPRNRLPKIQPKIDERPNNSDRTNHSISRDYALQLIASTDHLQVGVDPSQLASLSSPSAPQPSSQPSISTYRNRISSRPPLIPGNFSIGPGSTKINRGWTLAHRPSSSDVPQGPAGLWGALASPIESEEDQEDEFVPNFGDRRPVSHDSKLPDGPVDRTGWTKQLPQRTRSQRGLWGSALPLEDREAASRRRWTMSEQKL
ncbi:hypothetical protein N7478_011629 [Penicillium angulare]|uniref:uncharacterized protein n=1 Tax=Penicillium angulare TaxID=116970 RepID=UPI0025401F97|nr:uncharacterized protein N7478_011629 [Penicillium angulare]KAJ5261034.1 hypothetical protein N7478_011629 [Penicillium angulare]